MFGWLFSRKKEVEKVKEETRKGFDGVKNDINNIGKWIKHLNTKDSQHDLIISEMKQSLSSIESEVSGLKEIISMIDDELFKQLFKQHQTAVLNKQVFRGVQTPVQTPVQTGETSQFWKSERFKKGHLEGFSVMERAIIYVLLNSEMKLSYDDMAAMLGKDRATIRGHINRIKQKSEDLIDEEIEKNGKKRIFIPEDTKQELLKSAKVRVKKRGIRRVRK